MAALITTTLLAVLIWFLLFSGPLPTTVDDDVQIRVQPSRCCAP